MSFIRKIRKNGKIYLAEVKNQWIKGKCVQQHIRYVGREEKGKKILTTSISNAEISSVKLYGPLLVLNHIAQQIGLDQQFEEYSKEILSMVYAHCLDYKSINQMERWYERTDLSMILSLESVTESRLLKALDFFEQHDQSRLQQDIFAKVVKVHKLSVNGVIYDVTNTYLHGKKCPFGKLGHDKGGVKGRPLIQIALAVTKNEGIPICHKTFSGNISDTRTLQDLITDLADYNINNGMVVYDRGITSVKNIRDISKLQWNSLCGLAIRGGLIKTVSQLINDKKFIDIKNRVKLHKSIFYAITIPHNIDNISGTLVICFNEQQKRDLRESRYDEILYAQQQKIANKPMKDGMDKYFTSDNKIIDSEVTASERFDGYSCIFSTLQLEAKDVIQIYFGKDVIEKAFRSIKGITRLQPVRHWLYNRVIGHVFICYLAYLLLSILQHKLKPINITAEEALIELDTMYKVYLKDKKKDFKESRLVALTKKQELILKAVDKKLMPPKS